MIRRATYDDIEALAELMGTLGYPTTPDEMKARFKKIASNSMYQTFVTEKEHTITGMIGMMLGYHYEKNENYVRIVSLVVDPRYRQQGYGAQLLQQAESWANEQGANRLVLNSGNRDERADAHQFYLNQGFEGKATGFYKPL